MTSSHEPPEDQHQQAPGSAPTARGVTDPDALRQLAEQVHRYVTQAFDDWTAGVGPTPGRAQPEAPSFSRPASVPPVRMEQMARAPEPTADLDDLVDLLVPRLLEKLVPALRAALADD